MKNVYIDLDQTLIDTQPATCEIPGGIPFKSRNSEVLVYVRPYAELVLRQLSSVSRLCILTHGLTGPQTDKTRILGWHFPLIGRDRYEEVHPDPQSLLVDNTPPSSFLTQLKLETIGVDDSRFIVVNSFYAGAKDSGLLVAMKEVRRMLTGTTLPSYREWTEKINFVGPSVQPFRTYRKAKELAKEREDDFEKKLKQAAGPGKRVIVHIKTEKSFRDKTVDRGKDPKKVRDVLRAAILVDTKSQIESVVDSLRKNFVVKKIDHKTRPEEPFGYYGSTHVDVVIDNLICEIQIMTRKLWKHKRITDPIYQKYRSLDQVPKEEIEKCREHFRKGNSD